MPVIISELINPQSTKATASETAAGQECGAGARV